MTIIEEIQEMLDRMDEIQRPYYIYVHPDMKQEDKDILSKYGELVETEFVDTGKALLALRKEIAKYATNTRKERQSSPGANERRYAE